MWKWCGRLPQDPTALACCHNGLCPLTLSQNKSFSLGGGGGGGRRRGRKRSQSPGLSGLSDTVWIRTQDYTQTCTQMVCLKGKGHLNTWTSCGFSPEPSSRCWQQRLSQEELNKAKQFSVALSDCSCRQKRKILFIKSSHNINILIMTTNDFPVSEGALETQSLHTPHPGDGRVT